MYFPFSRCGTQSYVSEFIEKGKTFCDTDLVCLTIYIVF